MNALDHSAQSRTFREFLASLDMLRARQRAPWHALVASLRRSFAEPMRYVIGLAWAIGWILVSMLLGNDEPSVAITALLFSMLISSLAPYPWRVRLLPRRLSTRWAVVIANGAFATAFGYVSFCASLWIAALATHGTAMLGENFADNAQLFARISSFGFIMPLIGFPMALGEETERAMRAMKGREQRMRTLAEQARQIALRSQINPHFFFNSLNTIAALIPTRPREAERAVELLAESLRPVLMRAPSLVAPVEAELEVAAAYGRMEQLRLGERLHLLFDCEPDARGATLPSLCVQPLLENAINHGASRRSGSQVVSVRAHIERATLILDIQDGDAGDWTEEQRLAGETAHARDGHALANVSARLRSLLGEQAALDVRMAANGCWTRLTAPHVPFDGAREQAPPPRPLAGVA